MSVSYLLWIPLLPLLSAAVIRLFGRRLLPRSGVHLLACGSVFASFFIGVWGFLDLRSISSGMPALVDEVYPWIRIGTLEIWTRFVFDHLSSVMVLVVTGVGSLIHLYSTGYMAHEKEYERYFAYLNLFTGMMLILVLGDNLLTMFVGWEGVGLCSYLLIGFWFGVKENADAGKKAFVVNRIGDFGFVLGIMILFWAMGMETDVWSLDFAALREHANVFTTVSMFGVPAVTLATLFLFVGATGKSAQIPLYVWLPDAMAGPTPVSALIHAATMVTAGVYMIARLSFLFDLAPFTLHVVAIVGASTVLFAATIGLVQNDIKKVLAYSTVSQLGYMFLACGVGAYAAGIFHLMTHAFFKALLFLGAGSVIHALSGEQDLRKMGALRRKIPWTFRVFFVATLAISGCPFLAGFFSKDEILWQAYSSPHGHIGLWLAGVLAAGLTAFYMFRLLFLTFYGTSRVDHEVEHHIHESPWTMLVPLVILSVLSIVGGWLWWPGFAPLVQAFPHWLETAVVVHAHEGEHHALEMGLAAFSVLVATGGFCVAYLFYIASPGRGAAWATAWPRTYRALLNKYGVDEAYDFLFVRGTKRLSAVFFWFDSRIVDGLVNGSAKLLRILVFIYGALDRLVVDGLVNLTGALTIALGRRLRRMQTGLIQNYITMLAGAVVLLSMVWLSLLT